MTEKEKATKEALEWIERKGGARAFAKDMEEFGALIDTFYAQRNDLVKKYPDHWIGMYQDKVVVAKEFHELMRQMDETGIPAGEAFVEFLNTEEEDWIL